MPSKASHRDSLPVLAVEKELAATEIKSQITKGRRLLQRSMRSQSEIKQAGEAFEKWVNYSEEMLTRFFDKGTLGKQFYSRCINPIEQLPEERTWKNVKSAIISGTESGILFLKILQEQLHLYTVTPGKKQSTKTPRASRGKVFLVHGHDHATKDIVARYLETYLGLKVIVLHEQPSLSKTIIEKLEKHSEVEYAVVLLTPDDMGCPKDKAQLVKPRARQNVIFELGFFIGRLSREKVCALYTGDVELPSDYDGVLYISLEANDWRFDLAKEMRAAGVRIDLNNAYK